MANDTRSEKSAGIVEFPAVRRRRAQELRTRLDTSGTPSQVSERVIDRAAGEDARRLMEKVRRLVRSREDKGFGPRRIIAELSEQGVDQAVIAACVEVSDDHWFGIARTYVVKQYGRALAEVSDDPGRRQRQRIRDRIARNLNRRGFGSETVARTVESVLAALREERSDLD